MTKTLPITQPRDELTLLVNDALNQSQYKKRKDIPYHQVYAEWELSIEPVIELLQSLTSEEWHHVCKGATWHDGTLITIPSLFEYTYNEEPHELGHGKEIIKALKGLEP